MRYIFAIKSILLTAGVLLAIFPCSLIASDENMEPGNWVYPAMRSFELAGYLRLPPDMPWTRSEAEYFLDRILASMKQSNTSLTRRQKYLLKRLRNEFQGKGTRPSEREDEPLLLFREGSRSILFDLSAGAVIRKRTERDRMELDGLAIPSFLIDLGQGITIGASYRLRMGPEWDSNEAGIKPSARERSFRGLTSEYERGWLSFTRNRWRVLVGRDYIHWGPGRREGLLMSMTAGSFDQVTASVSLGRFTMSSTQVLLDPGRFTMNSDQATLDLRIQRRLAGHRLRIRLPRGIWLGISETVLYTGRSLDYSYLLPVGSYYANQYNENDDDNILVGVDWKIPLHKGLILYGELLIDDFQYENRGDAPDRLGFNMTAEGRICQGGKEIEFLAAYTYIDIFTYAHKDSLHTVYVTGNGDSGLNMMIGSPLGPDSDRWEFSAAAPVHPRVLVALGTEFTRHGEGNDLREWNREEDPDPGFPSGDVVRERNVYFSVTCDMGRGSYIRAGGGISSIDSPGTGKDDTGFAWLELVLDF